MAGMHPAGSSQARAAALHALAQVAGGDRDAPGLSPSAEGCLQAAVYGACPAPAERLLALLQQPFPELRIAAYRCAHVLALPSASGNAREELL